MAMVRSRHALTAVVFATAILPHLAPAQTPSAARREVNRTELEAQARQADSLGRTQEAFALHTRLRDGDFDVGDRILVRYEGLGLRGMDTLVVEEGRMLRLGNQLGDMSLLGVLRSELTDSVAKRVARYYRNEVVHVTPLLRLSIGGAVTRPGAYYLPTDAPLSDLLAQSGRDGNADPQNIVVRRGEVVVWAKDDVQSALQDGLTLQQLNLEPGDELVVGARNQHAWVLPVVEGGLSIIGLAMMFVRRR